MLFPPMLELRPHMFPKYRVTLRLRSPPTEVGSDTLWRQGFADGYDGAALRDQYLAALLNVALAPLSDSGWQLSPGPFTRVIVCSARVKIVGGCIVARKAAPG